MDRIVGKLAMGVRAGLSMHPSRWKKGFLLAGLLLLLGWGAGRAEAAAPVLQKVFVYAGEDRIRLVALFDQPLRRPDFQPLAGGDGISFFLDGVRGGRELRHFVVGQGGYKRVEAEERPGGLRLTVRGEQPIAHLKSRLGVTASGSAFTLTLPSLAGARLQLSGGKGAGRERDLLPATTARAAVKKAPKEPPVTPESILRQSLTPGAAPVRSAAPEPAPRKSAPEPRAQAKLPAPFGPSEAEGAPARPKPLTPADFGAGAPNLSGLMMKMGAALGGLLALLLGGLAAFKRWGGKAAGHLNSGGKVVRTLHRVYLAPKQSIAIVEVAGELLVIGISGQSISMLTKIENQAALARLRDGGEASFVEQLARLMGGKEKIPARPESKEKAPAALAALRAYAEGVAAKENGKANGHAGPNGDGNRDGHDAGNGHPAARPVKALAEARLAAGIPSFGLGPEEDTKKAVARLRERLGRVSPQWTASGVAS